MWVRSLGQEDHLKEEVATHSSILAMVRSLVALAWWVTVQKVAKSWMRVSTSTCV